MKHKIVVPYLVLMIILANDILAQSPPSQPMVQIPGTQVLTITSKIANQEYQLFVQLPGSYTKEPKKNYPVVYLLDAQYDFPFVTGVYGGQYYDGFLPELIIVGITWGGKNPRADSLRGHDFSPTHIDQMPESGGGPKFLEFIKKELMPYVASTYRVTDDRTLMGSSFGGLFTLYALFTDPSLFHRYVLTSPSLGWDNYVLQTYEKKFKANPSLKPIRLFMGIGEYEQVEEFQKFADDLRASKVKDLELETVVIRNTGHAGTKPEGFARGLQFVFDRPSLILSPSVLEKYSGTYASGSDSVKLFSEKGKLIANAGGSKLTLNASTEKDFYLKGVFVNLHFSADDKGKVSGFQLDQFGGGVFMKKVK